MSNLGWLGLIFIIELGTKLDIIFKLVWFSSSTWELGFLSLVSHGNSDIALSIKV